MGKAQTRAQNKYIRNNYDRINLIMPKGDKDRIKQHADQRGESVNAFINRAIAEAIQHDNEQK